MKKKIGTKVLAFMLSVLVAAAFVPTVPGFGKGAGEAQAATVTSGTANGVSWTLDDENVLRLGVGGHTGKPARSDKGGRVHIWRGCKC